jgi:hypothetical protein
MRRNDDYVVQRRFVAMDSQGKFVQQLLEVALNDQADGNESASISVATSPYVARFSTLLDMIRFTGELFAHVLVRLQDMEDGARNHCTFLPNRDQPVPPDHIRRLILPFLRIAQKQCEAVELTGALARIELFEISCKMHFTYQEYTTQAQVLREAIETDLRFRRFAYVPVNRAEQLDKIDSEWATVQSQFLSAKPDIRAAVECYALDRNTAAVFHAMRVVEWGLRALCASLGFRRLRQKFKKSGSVSYIPIEYSEWENILNQLQDRIDAKTRKIKRGPIKQQHQEFYYPVLQDIRAIRDAWRNHVMHTRQEYEAKDADAILGHVKRLMNTLATRIKQV